MACRKHSQGPWHELPAVGLRLQTPESPEVTALDGGVRVTLRPGGRSPTVLQLSKVQGRHTATNEFTLVTDHGLRVHYDVQRNDGGSGGAEAVVEGAAEDASNTWRFTCHSQAENPAPESECITLIRGLGVSSPAK